MSFDIGNPVETWAQDAPIHAQNGFVMPEALAYMTPDMKRDFSLAMDAVPSIGSTASAGVPVWFTTYVDPEVVRYAFAPVKIAEIAGERKMGDWKDTTAMFNVVEATGETSAYGDFSENGRSGVNLNNPQRQNFLFQVMEEYGELEVDRAGAAKLNYVSEINKASAENLNRFANFSYAFGIQGIQNYGLLNDPSLPGSLTPATKAYGGVKWINAGAIVATANEIYADIQALIYYVINASAGLVEEESNFVLAMHPAVKVALTATNSFGVDVYKLLEQNFPNIEIKSAVQYGATSSTNPQGVAAGNLVQLFAKNIEGNSSVFTAFSEKMRGHRLEVKTSSYKRKVTSGTWGTVVRYPIAFASLLGV